MNNNGVFKRPFKRPAYQLNNNCIKIISKFGRLIKKLDKTVILLQDKQVVQKVVYHAERTNHPELQQLATLLLKEINRPRVNQNQATKLNSTSVKEFSTLSGQQNSNSTNDTY